MKYDDPKLRDLLAGEYVLGVMPTRARARFERLMKQDAALARLVGEWAGRLAPVDATASAPEPPARVKQAIMRRIAPPVTAAPVAASRAPWFDSLRLWRGVSAAAAMAAVIALYVASRPVPAPVVVAILNDQNGQASWIATLDPGKTAFTVAAIVPQEIATATSLELWTIAGGTPRSLGLLAAQPNKPLALSTLDLPPEGGVLAVSLEPAGGSPTGQPTGPVLFQGKILAHSL
jgi:anti-sigma-K factor RskA